MEIAFTLNETAKLNHVDPASLSDLSSRAHRGSQDHPPR